MKWAAEEQLGASGTPWAIVGSSAFADTWIGLLRASAGTSGRPRVFGRAENPVKFVRVQDVAGAVVHAAAHRGLAGRVIEVGGPKNPTLNQLASLVQRSLGGPGTLPDVPRSALRAMGVTARPFNPTNRGVGARRPGHGQLRPGIRSQREHRHISMVVVLADSHSGRAR